MFSHPLFAVNGLILEKDQKKLSENVKLWAVKSRMYNRS